MQLTITSENPYLLDILHKNPTTDFGIYAKKHRNGVMIGNGNNSQEYQIIFQDRKNSYVPEGSNPIDFQNYCSPLLALHICNEFFSHLLKEKNALAKTQINWLGKTYEEIDTEKATIKIATFYVDSNWYRNDTFLLNKYIPGIQLTPKIGKNFSLEIHGKNIREAINILAIVASFCQFTNQYTEYLYIDDFFIQKQITILKNIENLPYFVFYLFIKRLMRSPEQFNEFKPQLEAYFNDNIQFVFTDTQESRKKFICDKINFDEPILDFGCGSLQYYKKLTKMGFRKSYWAHDAEDFEYLVDKLSEYEETQNLEWISNPQDLLDFKGQIILSEVIEHNTKEEAIQLLEWIKNNIKFSRLFITTPNNTFNKHYAMSEEFRHDDHDFELTKIEFETLLNNLFKGQTIEYFGVGDCVHGEYPTSGAIIHSL